MDNSTSSFTVGSFTFNQPLMLAPMAGVTDLPFRRLCLKSGADIAVGEMVTSDTRLWKTRKSALRLRHDDELEPRVIQIAGGDPNSLAEAALQNARLGAQIIDVNMGCPAKKVCKKEAGSALMRDPMLVRDILQAVCETSPVPVTLKIRTGWDDEHRNAADIAAIAEASGIQMLTIHGRTRSQKFSGQAEYRTIREIKQQLQIPVIANGDIDSPEKALAVLEQTGCDGLMIGRPAQGNPWIFGRIRAALQGTPYQPPGREECFTTVQNHLQELHQFYGEYAGLRIARKHLGWYLGKLPQGKEFIKKFNTIESAELQLQLLKKFFKNLDLAKEKAA